VRQHNDLSSPNKYVSQKKFFLKTIDYSVRNDNVAAQALQEIRGKNDRRDGSSNVSYFMLNYKEPEVIVKYLDMNNSLY